MLSFLSDAPADDGRTGDDGVFSDGTERGTGGQGGPVVGTQSSPTSSTTAPGSAVDPATGAPVGDLTGVGGDAALPGAGAAGPGAAGVGAVGAGGAAGTAGAAGGGNASAVFNQGVILWNAGKIADAKAQFEQAVKLDPNMAEAHYWLGMALINGGDTAGAKPHFETYLKLAPTGQFAETAKSIVASIK